MGPYSEHEATRPAGESPAPRFPDPMSPSQAEIHTYIDRGRRLRAAYMAGLSRRLGAWLRRSLRPRGSAFDSAQAGSEDFLGAVAHGLRTPLTAVRSAAEVLRDFPDLPERERNRLLDAVLAENERLTHLVSEILEGSEVKAHGQHWQIRTKALERSLGCPG
ncbi:MAG: hypothetical protein OEM59_17035 [Rhodospirillales bacterium]|nr:hypothetical protein [Rhodospirillales bacterium]